MAQYRPTLPFTTALTIYKPTYSKIDGVNVKVYPKNGVNIFASFRTFGGTDANINGVYSVIDTADIETWFTPDITSDCLIEVTATGAKYHIIGEPENINMRNQFLKFKVQRDKGGA